MFIQLCYLVNKKVTEWCSVYLRESVASAIINPAQRLSSACYVDLIVLRTRTKFRNRAFSVASPTVWNSFPESVRSTKTLPSFKRNLKTHLFNIAFN